MTCHQTSVIHEKTLKQRNKTTSNLFASALCSPSSSFPGENDAANGHWDAKRLFRLVLQKQLLDPSRSLLWDPPMSEFGSVWKMWLFREENSSLCKLWKLNLTSRLTCGVCTDLEKVSCCLVRLCLLISIWGGMHWLSVCVSYWFNFPPLCDCKWMWFE